MKPTFQEIKAQIDRLAEKINAPQHLLPNYGYIGEGAYVDIGETGQLYYVSTERGQELKRDLPFDIKHLLYLVFKDITFWMSLEFEVKNRRPNEDSRRQIFEKHVELLGLLNDDWKLREAEEQHRILKLYPYSDR